MHTLRPMNLGNVGNAGVSTGENTNSVSNSNNIRGVSFNPALQTDMSLINNSNNPTYDRRATNSNSNSGRQLHDNFHRSISEVKSRADTETIISGSSHFTKMMVYLIPKNAERERKEIKMKIPQET